MIIKQATDLLKVGGSIIDGIFGNKAQADEAKAKLNKAIADGTINLNTLQAQTNLKAAEHPSLFVAGARQSLFWVCTIGFAYQFVVLPLTISITAVVTGLAPDIAGQYQEALSLDTGPLMALASTLLGFGGLRTFEKHKGVARNSMKA